MKNYFILSILIIFTIHSVTSQSNLGASSGFFANKSVGPLVKNVETIDQAMLSYFDKSRLFNNKFEDTQRKGSYFLFSSWDNYGEVKIGEKRYTLTNINFDIEDDKFMSKMGGDSILVFDSNYIDDIKINNKLFKYIYDASDNKKKTFEVIHQSSKDLAILKGYYLKVILADPNPMLNRPIDEIKQRSNYVHYKDGVLTYFRLQKKVILNFIDKDNLEKVKKFVSKNDLSYKNENDLIKIFKYYDSL